MFICYVLLFLLPLFFSVSHFDSCIIQNPENHQTSCANLLIRQYSFFYSFGGAPNPPPLPLSLHPLFLLFICMCVRVFRGDARFKTQFCFIGHVF